METMIAPEPQIEEARHEWEIPAYKADAFRAKVEQANNKLARAGVEARFNVVYSDFEKPSQHNYNRFLGIYDGPIVMVPWVRAEMVGPLRLAHDHFVFVASLVAEEAGVTVHSAPGQELGGYAPRGDNNCDHCALERNRNRLYLVRDERDGSIIQLGHSCIELYTGIAPKGLWALTFDGELEEFTKDDVEGGFGPRDYSASVELVLAYAYAHSNQGRAYVPASSYDQPTVDHVRMSLFGRPSPQDRAYYEAKSVEAQGYLADAALLEAIKASVETTSADSDYGRNLRIILAGENVSGRNVGILASLVKVYAKAAEIEQERKANPVAKGFIGEVKERVRNFKIHLTKVQEFDGNYGTTTLFIGRTDSGHVVKWFASGAWNYEVGETMHLKAATVKAQENYQGQDQTVITRGAIDAEARRAELDAQ